MTNAEALLWLHVITVVSLVAFKIGVLLVGYLLGRLGHDLLIKGVSGEFKFKSALAGSTADLISSSPGVFFILMATALIAIAVIKDKPFASTMTERTLQSLGELPADPAAQGPPPALPPTPTTEPKP
jgi:hypothetical protein